MYDRSVPVSVPRVLALALTVALTFTPAVVGACAALLCAPVGGGAALVADEGHAGHHGAPVAAVLPDAHAHHASMHGAGHAEMAVVESGPAHHVALRLQFNDLTEHDCCANAGSLAVATVSGANRLDMAADADAAVRVSGSVAGTGTTDLQRSSTIPIDTSPAASAPLVLRI